ncbi:hypothetical protein ABB55_16795 [Prosthecomicrobium hirschii]|uniref:Uroporphyrinogen-III synthase n=1 Tax=Prosthecodimorpha hirschii TaxID=665126 RepID=A0A0P6WG74_9HYPH|nr:uroporphyrinogen-III synthase [Prosthecomicrobium hirschii]KPL53666.1 hypothetical protein ABB55_16795 [Prosthecomicrobium hirschii]
MRVLVVRPEPEAQKTAAALLRRGHEAIVAPLLAIVLAPNAAIRPDGLAALAVTSARALEALAARPDWPMLAGRPIFCVGDATATAAARLGGTDVRSAAGNAADLAALIAASLNPEAGAILYAAGRDRSGDLDGWLRAAGFAVDLVEVYRAEAAARLPEAAAAELCAGRIDAVLIHSRRTAEILVSCLTELRPIPDLGHVVVHAISAAAAEPLEGLGFRRIEIAPRPTAEAILETLSA